MANTFNHNDKVVITDGGSVGIGKTSSISAPLNVFNSSSTTIALFENNASFIELKLGDSSNTSYTNMVFYSNSGNAQIWKTGSGYTGHGGASSLNIYNSNGAIAFHPNNTDNAMFINTSGNVGIGTTSPARKLSVVEAGTQPPLYIQNTNNDGYSGAWLYSSAGTLVGHFGWANGTTSALSDKMYFGTIANKDVVFTTNDTEKVRITAGGNVGIGTTSPVHKTEIRRLESTNRTTYTDILSINADADNAPYNGHGGGILFRGQTYSGSGNNNQGNRLWGRIGMYLNDSYDNFSGESMFFAVAPDDRSDDLITAMTIKYNGNVGIGTTEPARKLDVNGEIRTRSATIDFGNGTDTQIWGDGTNLNLKTNGSERVIITSAGNVGIGTTSPSYKLDVVGQVRLSDNLYVGANKTSGTTLIQFNNFDATLVDQDDVQNIIQMNGRYWSGNNNQIIKTEIRSIKDSSDGNGGSALGFGTQTGGSGVVEHMRIDKSGNVGIGTTRPAFKLEVNAGANAGVFLQGSSDVRYHVFSSSSIDWVGYELRSSNVNSFAGGMFRNNAANDRISIYNKNAEAISILDTGNVGIGTTSPGAKLDIKSATNSNAIFVREDTDNSITHNFWIDSSDNGNFWMYANGQSNTVAINSAGASWFNGGNVGIGTTSPSRKLHVVGSEWDNTGGGGVIFENSNTVGASLTLKPSSSAVTYGRSGWAVYAGGPAADIGDGNLGFWAHETNQARMVIQRGGNVGIGTTNTDPLSLGRERNLAIVTTETNAALTIVGGLAGRIDFGVGSTRTAGIYSDSSNYTEIFTTTALPLVFSTNSAEKMRITSAGNVGIGTTSPQKKLDVNGSGIVASFGGAFGPGDFAGIHFGYSETIYNNDAYKKSAIVFERTDNHGQGGNASGRIHFLLNNISNGSATSLSHSVVTIDTDASATQGSARVGIGTTSPSYALHINGNGSGLNLSGGNNRIYFGGNRAIEGSSDGGTLQLGEGYTQVLLQGSNIGIGTTSPTVQLDIYNGSGWGGLDLDGTAGGEIRLQKNGTTYGQIYASNGEATGMVINAPTANSMSFQTNSSERMRITSAGNVGIGTASPIAKLDVAGEIRSTGGFTSDDGNFTRILNPGGASYSSGSTTGTIKITLPLSWTNTMMRIVVKVFDYADSEGFTVELGGYNYAGSGGYWANTYAYITSSPIVDRNFNVRFGHDGTKCCIYIGETTQYWSYLKVAVTEAQFGHSNFESYRWNDGWDVRETSILGTISSTQSSTQISNWARSGQNLYYGSGSGNVGIGTTSPSNGMTTGGVTIGNLNGNYGFIELSSNDVNNYGPWIDFSQATGADYKGRIRYWTQTNSFKFYTNESSTELVTFTSDNVGIGTSSPGSKLDVAGDVRFGTGGGTAWGKGLLTMNSGWSTNEYPTLGSYGGTEGSLIMLHNPHIPFRTDNAASSSYTGRAGLRMAYDTAATNWWDMGLAGDFFHIYKAGTGEFLRITNTGNVGIGTTSPGSTLSVNGTNTGSVPLLDLTASGSGAFQRGVRMLNTGMSAGDSIMMAVGNRDNSKNMGQFYFYYAGNESNSNRISMGLHSVDDVFNILGTGNVGIGTTSPSSKLHVEGASGSIYVKSTTNNQNSSIYFDSMIGTSQALRWEIGTNIGNQGDLEIYDRVSLATRFLVETGTGNVGIGTTSPSYKLEVSGGAISIKGNTAGNSLRFDDSGGTSRNAMYVDTSNYLNVGNANYAGIKLYHTATAPQANGLQGNQIAEGYGVTENGKVLAEPNAWLAVRIGTTDYAIPMYSTE